MSQNLKLRIITALIGVPAILIMLTAMGVEGVALFSWLVSMGMTIEFSRLFFTLSDSGLKTLILLTLTSLFHFFNYYLSVGLSSAFLGIAPFFILFIIFLLLVPRLLNFGGSSALNSKEGSEKLSRHFQELLAACFGMIYTCWLPLLMVSIRQAPQGKHWLVFTMLVVWSADSFAYFGGKYFGKKLLFETVSPKKTWEGSIAGALGALVVSLIFSKLFLNQFSMFEISVMSLTMSVASMLGDLCESLMKRAVNVKDSGSILPGHGGFLDRFDGVMFALPVMFTFLWLLA